MPRAVLYTPTTETELYVLNGELHVFSALYRLYTPNNDLKTIYLQIQMLYRWEATEEDMEDNHHVKRP